MDCWHGKPSWDLLEYEGAVGRVWRFPQGPANSGRGTFTPIDFPKNEKTLEIERTEKCARLEAPRAKWRVADRKLWLVSLLRGDEAIPLWKVYGGDGRPLIAEWISTRLEIQVGKRLCEWDLGDTIHEETVVFEISRGEVLSVTGSSNRSNPAVPTKDDSVKLLKRWFPYGPYSESEIEQKASAENEWRPCLTPADQNKLRNPQPSQPNN